MRSLLLAALCLLTFGSCDNSTIHIMSGGGIDASIRIDSAPVTPSVHPVGIPVGPYDLPVADYDKPYYSGAVRTVTPDSVVLIMNLAEDQFFDLFVNLAGPRENYQNPDSTFCLSCFKSRLDLFAGVDFSPFTLNATVRGHILFEEPENAALWGGTPVPYEDIDSAAAYSRQLFPLLPVGVGAPPSFLVGGAPYAKLDFGVATYSTDKGGVGGFIESELAVASAADLTTVFALDVLDGNAASPMTAPQVRHWGKKIACEPLALGILLRDYDPGFFADTTMQKAVRDVVRLASFGGYRDIECGRALD
jgi:hypothetical protein